MLRRGKSNDEIPNDATELVESNIVSYPTITGADNAQTKSTYYYKLGTRVFVTVAVKNLTSDQFTDIFTLPAGYRPIRSINTIGQTSSGTVFSFVNIGSSGIVSVNPKTSSYAFCSIMFDAFG